MTKYKSMEELFAKVAEAKIPSTEDILRDAETEADEDLCPDCDGPRNDCSVDGGTRLTCRYDALCTGDEHTVT